MKQWTKFFAIGVVAMLSSLVGASGLWNKIHDKDGIKVMTRPFEGSSFLEFRGEMTLDNDLASITQFLWTTEDMCKWMDDCVSVNASESTETTRKIHIVNAAPGLLSNRDVVIENTITQDPQTYVVRYTMNRLPETDKLDTSYVHIPKFKGVVELLPQGPNKTIVAYQAHFEAGGVVAGWMANLLVKKNPLNTLRDARKIITEKDYPAHSAIKNFPG